MENSTSPLLVSDEVDNTNFPVENDDACNKRKRQKKSEVWPEMTEIVDSKGESRYECKHCHFQLAKIKSGTTSHLKRHLTHCERYVETKKNHDDKLRQQQLSFGPLSIDSTSFPPLRDGKFCMEQMKESAATWILMHDHPFSIVEEEGFNIFCRSGMPQWTSISCVMIYELERKKLSCLLKAAKNISLTTDLWKSKNQKIEYMVVTAHWIDSDCKLNKRVLSFFNIPPPRGGPQISDAILKCARDWEIENKIFTVSVDNASVNDVAIRNLLNDLLRIKNNIVCGGKLFHVRCCAHILNLIAQDGLTEIKDIVDDVRRSVDFIRRTDSRLLKFAEIVKYLNLSERKLIDDCKTRWNSTYEMIQIAISFKEVFTRFKAREPSYVYCPIEEQWKKLEKVFSILKVLYEATKEISGTEYPTSSLFLNDIFRVKMILDENSHDEDEFICRMIEKMKRVHQCPKEGD
ncbi:zinc finger BED domain-containing protein RICESLEEPER 1-like [Dorcoceras hygrometricum]|uniref:Zinc finger BED domain-containing protein RICESLEEPER 1-like n=1 Tax=Dorcoceras hygrometricum TaxID=472368 RepID=A0A2Z7CCW0_9LAMI|nr:zinc finger BED domain-containing protein RICESLEEPER 1-like [Dorcoceras hygrometricum]